jgi:hypothetical protein
MMQAVPVRHRPLHSPPLPRTPLGVESFAPVDKGTRIGWMMEYCTQCGGSRFAPMHLPSLSPRQWAPWQ